MSHLQNLLLHRAFFDPEQIGGCSASQQFSRVTSMSLREEVFELIDNPRLNSFGRIGRNPEIACNLICGAKSNAVNIACKSIRIFFYNGHRIIPIHLVNLGRLGWSDPIALQEDHDVSHGFLFHPSQANPNGSFGSNSGDLFETSGKLIDHLESFQSKMVYNPFREFGSDAFDQTGA